MSDNQEPLSDHDLVGVDTPLGKDTGEIRTEVTKWEGMSDYIPWKPTILALCDALEEAHQEKVEEVAEFNAGWNAAHEGQPKDAEPDCLKHDVWRNGWDAFMCDRYEARLREAREENERLRDELQQCHEELAEAWEVNIESVDVMLAEKRDRVKRFRSGGEEKT